MSLQRHMAGWLQRENARVVLQSGNCPRLAISTSGGRRKVASEYALHKIKKLRL